MVEPDDAATLEKRGTVYVIFDISGSEEFDTTLVSKVVNDILHDSYYQSENISPIQSLERAISEVRDRVTKLTNESIRIHESTVEFNLLAGVLWGNVLYVVCYGDAASFLIRDGDIKPISSNAEGNFSAASGVVKDDDVVIFSTKKFVEKVSPERLLNSSVTSGDLPLEASSMILKIVVDTRFSEYEVVDFGIKDKNKKESKPNILSKLFTRKPKEQKKAEIDIRLRRGFGKKQKVTSAIILLALLFVGSIAYTVHKNSTKLAPEAKNQENKVLSTASEKPAAPVIDTSKDAEYKISRISPEAFYDLKLTDPAAAPSSIEVTSKALLAYDPVLKKVFTSDLQTPKFVASDQAYLDKGIYDTYLGNTYTLSGDTITKQTTSGDKSTWAQSSVLTGGRSISIDMNIYILKSDGTLLKFLQGTQQTFSIVGLDKPLASPTQVLTDYDFNNIYIADGGNKRIVVLDKKGILIKQFLSSDLQIWNNIKSIAVSSDEKTLYVLDGTVVYSVQL